MNIIEIVEFYRWSENLLLSGLEMLTFFVTSRNTWSFGRFFCCFHNFLVDVEPKFNKNRRWSSTWFDTQYNLVTWHWCKCLSLYFPCPWRLCYGGGRIDGVLLTPVDAQKKFSGNFLCQNVCPMKKVYWRKFQTKALKK